MFLCFESLDYVFLSCYLKYGFIKKIVKLCYIYFISFYFLKLNKIGSYVYYELYW